MINHPDAEKFPIPLGGGLAYCRKDLRGVDLLHLRGVNLVDFTVQAGTALELLSE